MAMITSKSNKWFDLGLHRIISLCLRRPYCTVSDTNGNTANTVRHIEIYYLTFSTSALALIWIIRGRHFFYPGIFSRQIFLFKYLCVKQKSIESQNTKVAFINFFLKIT